MFQYISKEQVVFKRRLRHTQRSNVVDFQTSLSKRRVVVF
jgi:hypothetical protein